MKISINNLEKFFLILEGKEIISKDDVEHLLGFLDKEDGYEKYSLSFKDRSLLTFTGKDSQYIKNYYDELNEKIDEINNKIKNGISKVDKNTKETFEKLSDSLDFLNNKNKDMAFIYVPITIKNQENKGAISILKKRKENFNKGDKISIFINLDMSHLNRVKIYCEFKAELVSISFDLTKENVSLFKKNETMLENIIEENGYKLNNINYIEDKEINFLDTLVYNKNPYYYLDVRVQNMKKNNNKKGKKSIALKYSKDDTAPIITAKGKGYVAENIIKKGKEEKIEIYEDKELLNDLMKIEIGQEIPPELYDVVAQIITYVYYLDKKKGDLDE